MSFTDILFLVVAFAILIPTVIVCNYVWGLVMPQVQATSTADVQDELASLDSGWDKNVSFFNASYAALFILMGLVSIVLTVLVASHPVFLVVWLLFNLMTIFIYDSVSDFMDGFLAMGINSGEMSDAASFFESGMPKIIVFFNMLMAIVMLGKRVLYQ